MMAMVRRTVGFVLVAAACLALQACTTGEHEELTQWVADQRKQQRVRLPPIAAPKKFVPQAYAADETADPYSPQRLTAALRREARPTSDSSLLVKPELARQAVLKQPLESVPLDAMAYVGQVIRDGTPSALLRVNGLIYRVKQGDYLGQNFGKIVRIGDSEISLREIVQDTEGEWSERKAAISLQQGAK
jgi:type IV pilus assembly protein PilP